MPSVSYSIAVEHGNLSLSWYSNVDGSRRNSFLNDTDADSESETIVISVAMINIHSIVL